MPIAIAADTSSSTHTGNTKSSGYKKDSAGTVTSAAPNAEIPKMTYAAVTTSALMARLCSSKGMFINEYAG